MNLVRAFLLSGILLGADAVAAPASAAGVEIDSFAALTDYAGRNQVRVKMKPGVYTLNDAQLARAAIVAHPARPGKIAGQYQVNTLLHFAGHDSVYDLTGVVLQIDTRLHQSVRGPHDKILVSGHRTTIRGLEVVDLGDTPPGKGGLRLLHVIGDGNVIAGVTLRARGSSPYGYGNLLGKGGNALVPLHKQSCLLITGRDTQILGTQVVAHVFGHGIVMQGAVNTLIRDCTVEGELRLTDDMLKETSGPAHRVGFESDYPPGRIVPGVMVALSEDGIRAYANGSQVGGRRTENITVINCAVKNMRSGFDLVAAAGKVSVAGSTARGCTEKGYSIPSGGEIAQCAGDAAFAPLLSLHEKSGRDCRVELTLLDAPSDHPPSRVAEINGSGHRITLRNHAEPPPRRSLPIVFWASFWADVHHFRAPATTLESWTGARAIELHNHTGLPIVLGRSSRDCVVHTAGQILRDDGANNQVRPLAPPQAR